MNDDPVAHLFGALALLIVLSGFFSGSETGLMALNRYKLKHLKKTGHPGAKRASKLLERPESTISLILIGNNAVNILASSIATLIALRLIGESGIYLSTAILTVVVLIFAEIIPKTVAAYNPERVAYPVSLILLPLRSLLAPIIAVFNWFTHFLLRITGIEPKDGGDPLSVDELRTIVGEAGHMIPKRHKGMLLNILDLEEMTVDDIMIPRNEVYGVDLSDELETIIYRLKETEYTRIPVYKDDINNILGILHQRDLIAAMSSGQGLDRDALSTAMREPYFIPEGTPLHTQLFNFQKQKKRLGIVVDEYGDMQGIVTLEDLLEEIVGDFTSNLAEENKEVQRQEDGSFLIDGTSTLRDINRSLRWDLPVDGPKTLNGLMLEHLESFPDGAVCVQLGEYQFEILEIRDNLIQSARAQRAEAA